jgi:mRNA interferase RelE/StbE
VKVAFRQSFERDPGKIKDRSALQRVRQVVEQVEHANNLQEVQNVRKLAGAAGFFRILVGEYRIGIALVADEVEFVRCLHRRDMYRYFP